MHIEWRVLDRYECSSPSLGYLSCTEYLRWACPKRHSRMQHYGFLIVLRCYCITLEQVFYLVREKSRDSHMRVPLALLVTRNNDKQQQRRQNGSAVYCSSPSLYNYAMNVFKVQNASLFLSIDQRSSLIGTEYPRLIRQLSLGKSVSLLSPRLNSFTVVLLTSHLHSYSYIEPYPRHSRLLKDLSIPLDICVSYTMPFNTVLTRKLGITSTPHLAHPRDMKCITD